MTTPNGEGVNTSDESWNTLAWMVSGPDQPNTTRLSTLSDRDQDTVTAAHADEIQNSPGWNTSSADICDILTGNPIVGGLFGLGTADTPTGRMVSGGQYTADTICGFLSGNPNSADTSPQTLLTGAGAMSDQVADNSFAQGVLDMGGGADPTTGLAGGFCTGGMSFLGMLCGIGTGSTDVSLTTPQSVVSSAQGMASGAHLLMGGVPKADATGPDLFAAGATAIGTNNANINRSVSLNSAQSIALKQENLLISQEFSHSYNVAPDPLRKWQWYGSDGAVTMGCLEVTCDGTEHQYVSNEVAVVADETIELSCMAKAVNLVYTGTDPIAFGVEKYKRTKDSNGFLTYIDIAGYDVATIESPDANTDWLDMAGTYVVPPGVDQLRFRFKVNDNATSGKVRFDEANFLLIDLIARECVPETGLTVDNIVTQLYGSVGEGFTQNDVAVALGNTAAALTSATAKLAALDAQGHTGSIAGDDFGWSGEITANPNWDGWYSDPTLTNGHYEADHIDATFVGSGFTPFSTNQECWFAWVGDDAESASDYQLIQVILDSAPVTAAGFYPASIRVLGRISADWGSLVMAEFVSDGTWSLKSLAAGIWTTIGSGTCTVPGLGSTISLYCGDKDSSTLRHFKLTVGTTVIFDETEIGTSSVVGASNRNYGWGALATGGLYFALITFLPAQGVPPKVNTWLAMDQ